VEGFLGMAVGNQPCDQVHQEVERAEITRSLQLEAIVTAHRYLAACSPQGLDVVVEGSARFLVHKHWLGREQPLAVPQGFNFIVSVLVGVSAWEVCAMISFHQRLQCLPMLFGGIAAGLMLAIIARTGSGVESAMVMLMAALPFLLAALIGVAKTTTA
jgi:hypothetical protein